MKIFTNAMTSIGVKGFLLTICLGVAAPGLAGAADFDGSRDLLCVPTDAIQCEGAGECSRTEVEALNIPKFVHVEFKAKRLRGTRELSGSQETTAIQNVQKLEDGEELLEAAPFGGARPPFGDGQSLVWELREEAWHG